MTIQTPEQEICRLEGDSVTVLLPSTTMILTHHEANRLNGLLQNDLIRDFCETIHGEGQSETICIADVPIPRSEAWRLHNSLERIDFSDEESVTMEKFHHDRVHWLEEGF